MSCTVLEMPTAAPDGLKEERGLSAVAFSRLLEWLDDGVDSYGEKYLEMRRRLIAYFDRRNRPFADDLAAKPSIGSPRPWNEAARSGSHRRRATVMSSPDSSCSRTSVAATGV